MRRILLTAFVLLVTLSMPVLAYDGAGEAAAYICDLAGLLQDGEISTLETQAGQLAQEYACTVSVLIVEDYRAYAGSMEALSDRYYEALVSSTGREDAILLTMSMAERDYWLKDYGELPRYAITDHGHEALQDAFLDDFGDDAWAEGFADYLTQAGKLLEAAEQGTPLDKAQSERLLQAYGIGFAAALVLAFVTCSVFKAQMKTAVKATSADSYVVPGGVDIGVREDRFTHTTRTRRKIETSRHSSGGGGRNHSSGGKF